MLEKERCPQEFRGDHQHMLTSEGHLWTKQPLHNETNWQATISLVDLKCNAPLGHSRNGPYSLGES